MTSVRFLPVAEQYPSSTAVSSAVASQRISGIADQPKKYRHRQSWRAGLRKTPKRRRETGVDMSGGLLRFLCRLRKTVKLQRNISSVRNLSTLPARNHRLGYSKLFGNAHL